jgi:hypothetical protein
MAAPKPAVPAVIKATFCAAMVIELVPLRRSVCVGLKTDACKESREGQRLSVYLTEDSSKKCRGVATCVYQPLHSPTLMLMRNNAAGWYSVVELSFRIACTISPMGGCPSRTEHDLDVQGSNTTPILSPLRTKMFVAQDEKFSVKPPVELQS